MNRRLVYIAFMMFFISSVSSSSEKRLDPLLKNLLVKEGVIAGKGLIPHITSVIKPENYRIPIYVISERPLFTLARLNSFGYRFRRIGNLLYGRIDIRDISSIMVQEEVLYISAATPKRLYLDKSIPYIKADLIHQQFNLPFAITGKGVVLGIIDTGLDYTHQDFISESGEMRTKYIWYQDVNPENRISPVEYGYGDECNIERIKLRDCPYKDVIGHGTHCSGIMGSDSRRYKGLAPEGVYVVAKSGTFENLVDGIEYIFKRGTSLMSPVVINMSLGGHYGPHDGTSPEEIAIADMLNDGEAEGRVIVVAAGNEGSSNIHLGYQSENNPRKTLMNIKNSSGFAIINLWRPSDRRLSVSIGIQKDVLNELVETDYFDGSDGMVVPLIYEGRKYAEVQFDSVYYPPNKKNMYLILINKNCSDCISSGVEFYIKTKGDTYFDAWFADEDFFSGGSSFADRSDNELIPGDSKRTIGMPASSPYVISVAAFVSRKEYTDIDGNLHTLKDDPGDIAYFSSIGPTSDENRTGVKPDIAAPGRIIISAFSSDAIQLQPGTLVDRFHIAMQGTSMACPHIAGLVALMLSIDPHLTANRVKRILHLSADSPYEDFKDFDYRWGYGIVNAYEAIKMVLKRGICENQQDCRENMSCVNNYCRGLNGSECNMSLDCLSPLICENKKCLSSYNGNCERDSDCVNGLECIEKRCVKAIEIAEDKGDLNGSGCGCSLLN